MARKKDEPQTKDAREQLEDRIMAARAKVHDDHPDCTGDRLQVKLFLAMMEALGEIPADDTAGQAS